MATDMTVANTIRTQIGAVAFFMMGTKQWAGDENSLSFPIKGCAKYTHIRITLEPTGTYQVDFIKVGRAHKYHPLKVTTDTVEGVYVDVLHDLISRRTGLALRMPRIEVIKNGASTIFQITLDQLRTP